MWKPITSCFKLLSDITSYGFVYRIKIRLGIYFGIKKIFLFPHKEYQFSDWLCEFMDKEEDFFNSLKLSNPKRFILIPRVIILSHTVPPHPKYNDQVIGIFYYDRDPNLCREHNRFCRFKQDYIINLNSANQEFISYSGFRRKGRYGKPIVRFFAEYGNNGTFYHNGLQWHHHYQNVGDLPNEPVLRSEAAKIERYYK
jgi:hypothetical protein